MKKYLTLEVLIDETYDGAEKCAKEIISDAMCHYYCCDGTVKIIVKEKSENISINDFEYFEKFGLKEEDFKVDIYKVNLNDTEYKSGVEVGIPQIDISVKCHSEKSQLKNKAKCLEMLKLIVDDMMNQ